MSDRVLAGVHGQWAAGKRRGGGGLVVDAEQWSNVKASTCRALTATPLGGCALLK